MKRRELFFIIIFLIFLISGGCGGSGGDGSSTSSIPAGSITMAWDAPTTNADGSPSTDLKGYWVYYGTSSGLYSEKVYAGNATTYTLTGLTLGRIYYLAVTAVDTSDNESNLSNEASGVAK